jgi:hypothetical protein
MPPVWAVVLIMFFRQVLAWQCAAVEACTGLRDSVGVKMRSKLFKKPPAGAVHHDQHL